jgi:hypothetical protein
MPIINRPNTDTQRLRALNTAKAKAKVTDPSALAFDAATLARLDTALPQFSKEVQERGAALSAQALATAKANPVRKTLNMYIRHFIAVFNLGVDRDKYPAASRAYYQLAVDYHQLPSLGSDAENIQWANNIVAGEAARVSAGGDAMENPTAAEVESVLTDLQNALAAQTPAKDAYDKEQEDVENMRADVDDVLADIWDEVLFTFRKGAAPSMRRKAREYGVVYRLSNNEEPTPEEFSVTGIITDSSTSQPLADVQVTVIETNTAAITNDAGEYLVPLLPAGNYTLRFSKDGYTTQELPVAVASGQITEVDVALTPEPNN